MFQVAPDSFLAELESAGLYTVCPSTSDEGVSDEKTQLFEKVSQMKRWAAEFAKKFAR